MNMTVAANSHETISPGRLWFGFAGSALAWIALGISDLLLTWQVCSGHEQYGGSRVDAGWKLVYFTFALVLLITALSAGVVSFRNWRSLSKARLSTAEGREREEYMALAGVFMSFTMGIGIVWLGMTFFFIDLCVRAR